jgi:hypothetical protein
MKKDNSAPAHDIAFGFDRATDEQSLSLFLQRFVDRDLLDTLLPRLQDDETIEVVDMLTKIMQKHLSEKEYHALFLKE